MTEQTEAPSPRRTRVIYVAGAKNCGSTLLDAILGNAPGALSLGEVGGFHRFRVDAACDCRKPPASCTLCLAALDAVGGCRNDDFRSVSDLPLKERRAHWVFLPTRSRRRYAAMADAVFEQVAAVSGADVLIDSSKNASRAAALTHDSRFDVRVIHIVRDGRGHLRSRRSRAEVDGKRYVALVAMVSWLTKNLLIRLSLGSRLSPDRYLLCRYEDLLLDPEGQLRRLGEFAGLDTSDLAARAVTEPGLARHHLFEPARRSDYRMVRLDASRLASQRQTPARNARFWILGGFISSRWGYDRQQSYLTTPR